MWTFFPPSSFSDGPLFHGRFFLVDLFSVYHFSVDVFFRGRYFRGPFFLHSKICERGRRAGRGNLCEECLGRMSESPCRITSLYVQRLGFVTMVNTRAHTDTHIQLLTGYTISSASWAKKYYLISCHLSADNRPTYRT